MSCTTLLGKSSFISLSTVFLSTGKKQKLKLRFKKQQRVLILGWFLYLIMACRTGLLDNRLWRSFSQHF